MSVVPLKSKPAYLLLLFLWGISGYFAQTYNPKIDPDWALIIPSGFFIGGIIFTLFTLIDNLSEFLKIKWYEKIMFTLLLVISLITSYLVVTNGLSKEFSGHWNLWFLITPYIFQILVFGPNKFSNLVTK